jgi:hypothetical protein
MRNAPGRATEQPAIIVPARGMRADSPNLPYLGLRGCRVLHGYDQIQKNPADLADVGAIVTAARARRNQDP